MFELKYKSKVGVSCCRALLLCGGRACLSACVSVESGKREKEERE